jgi:hypothetical protein
MQTHFTTHTLAEIFRDLYLGERRGVLALKGDDIEKRIHFDRGLIVYADSDLPQEDLGRALIDDGKLSTGALDEAKANLQYPGELAGVLINRDLVSKDALLETVRRLTRRVVSSVFQWEGGTARFAEGSERPDFLESDVLTTCAVILEGVFGMNQFAAIHEAMMGLDNRLGLAEPAPLPVERLTLSPSQGFILSRLDGATTVRDVVSILPPGEEEVATRFLYGLLVLGVVRYEPKLSDGPFRVANILRDHADRRALEAMQEKTIRRAYTQMGQQDPYEILGVAPSASRVAIERAYEEAKALFHRERLLPRVREQFRAELAVIESRLIEAYLKLSQPEAVRPEREEMVQRGPQDAVTADDLLVRVEMDKTKSKLAHEKATKVPAPAGSTSRSRTTRRQPSSTPGTPTTSSSSAVSTRSAVSNCGPGGSSRRRSNSTRSTRSLRRSCVVSAETGPPFATPEPAVIMRGPRDSYVH